jgi:DDE domain
MVVRLAGRRMYLWRAVDREGEILDVLVQRRRDRRAAVKLMRKLMRKQGFAPKRVVTDELRSYGAAFQHLRLSCHHEQGLRQNNRPRTRTRWCGDESASCSGSNHRASPAVPQHACRSPQHIQPATPSCLLLGPPDLPIRCGCAMAQRNRRRMKPSPVAPVSGETALLQSRDKQAG